MIQPIGTGNQNCVSCQFYDTKERLCRRYAPKPILACEAQSLGNLNPNTANACNIIWPIIDDPKRHWCGEYEYWEQQDGL